VVLAIYLRELVAWADAAGILTFVFEAFDEPWKGSADPLEPEKHWGLYTVDRRPKMAVGLIWPGPRCSTAPTCCAIPRRAQILGTLTQRVAPALSTAADTNASPLTPSSMRGNRSSPTGWRFPAMRPATTSANSVYRLAKASR